MAADVYAISPHLVFASPSEIDMTIAFEIGHTPALSAHHVDHSHLLRLLLQYAQGIEAAEVACMLSIPVEKATELLERLVENHVLLRLQEPLLPLMGMGAVIERADTPAVAATLARTRVRIFSSTEMFYLEQLHARLAQLGVHVSSEPETDLTMVVGTSPDDPLFEQVNEESYTGESPLSWAVVIPFNGVDAWLGPLHHRGYTGCYRCFRHHCLDTGADTAVVPTHSEGDPDMLEALVTRIQIGITVNRINRWVLRRFTIPPYLLETAVQIHVTDGRVALTGHRSSPRSTCSVCSAFSQHLHAPSLGHRHA